MSVSTVLRLPVPKEKYDAHSIGEMHRAVEEAFARSQTQEDSYYTFALGQNTTERVIPFAAAMIWAPFTQGANAKVFLTANVTFTFDRGGIPAGGRVRLVTQQDGTGGRTITWPADVVWGLAGAPAVDTTLSTQSVFEFELSATNKWLGTMRGTKYAL